MSRTKLKIATKLLAILLLIVRIAMEVRKLI